MKIFAEGLSHSKGCYIIFGLGPEAYEETWARLKICQASKETFLTP